MVEMSASQFTQIFFTFYYVRFLLFIFMLLGMNNKVFCKPVEWSDRSAQDDILAGVDFLSVFMNSAEERRNYEATVTTYRPALASIEKAQNTFNNEDSSTTIDNHILTNNYNDATTIEPDDELTTTVLPNEEIPFQNNNDIRIIEVTQTTTRPVTFVKNNPSAIQSNSKRNNFNIDETEPITIDSDKSDVKVKRKSEDLLAIGANPDYIAQQHARINRDNQYNHPYNHRTPTSRGRSVSYSAVIQVLPPANSNIKNWKQEDAASSKDYDNYDYTESHSDYQNKNISTFNNAHVGSTAESKDYFVTRKYNPGEFNESGDKTMNQQKSNIEMKKNFPTSERNWGVPEKNYGVPEKNYGLSEPQYQQSQRDGGKTERNWGIQESQRNSPPLVYGRPEQNYEVDESVSVITNGRTHGIQDVASISQTPKINEKPLQFKVGQSPPKPDDNQKVGYVVEGRNYRKYRVEERTADGFIVGEYGVVSNNDGSLRGVRYTADGTINPRVIYDALMKFLAL